MGARRGDSHWSRPPTAFARGGIAGRDGTAGRGLIWDSASTDGGAFQGDPWRAPRPTRRRANRSPHVRGHDAEGAITTPFDPRAGDRLDRPPYPGAAGSHLNQPMHETRVAHEQHIDAHGQDVPEIRDGKRVTPA